jgi:hypothetical protein
VSAPVQPAPQPAPPPPVSAPVSGPAAADPVREQATEPVPAANPPVTPEPVTFAEQTEPVAAVSDERRDFPSFAAVETGPERAPEARDSELPPPPPFAAARRPRRNPAKLLTMLAASFALLVVGIGGAIAWFGMPAWAEDMLVIRAANDTDLVIELPENAQDHRELPNGTIYFAASGTIINPTDRAQRVPPIKAELRDAAGAIVYEWIIPPPIAVLPPGERADFREARADIPRRAVELTASWASPR